MNVNGIGAAGYPAAGYETRRARRNYSDQMCNMVPAAQSSGGTFELHISNDKDGKAIGSMCGADYSLTVYQPKDFDPANPVYKVKVWDKDGNVTERMVDVSKVDTMLMCGKVSPENFVELIATPLFRIEILLLAICSS